MKSIEYNAQKLFNYIGDVKIDPDDRPSTIEYEDGKYNILVNKINMYMSEYVLILLDAVIPAIFTYIATANYYKNGLVGGACVVIVLCLMMAIMYFVKLIIDLCLFIRRVNRVNREFAFWYVIDMAKNNEKMLKQICCIPEDVK